MLFRSRGTNVTQISSGAVLPVTEDGAGRGAVWNGTLLQIFDVRALLLLLDAGVHVNEHGLHRAAVWGRTGLPEVGCGADAEGAFLGVEEQCELFLHQHVLAIVIAVGVGRVRVVQGAWKSLALMLLFLEARQGQCPCLVFLVLAPSAAHAAVAAVGHVEHIYDFTTNWQIAKIVQVQVSAIFNFCRYCDQMAGRFRISYCTRAMQAILCERRTGEQ